MKNLHRLLPAALLVAALLAAFPARAQQKGAMQIGLAARYAWPGMDLQDFGPVPGYGAVFRYSLTTTTTIDVGVDYLALSRSLDAPVGDATLDYTMYSAEVGVRYRPKLDLALRPWVEGGLGYEFWTTKIDVSGAENGSGSSTVYYAGLGCEWEFIEDWTLSGGARYYYLPQKSSLASEVVTAADGKLRVENDDLLNGALATAGIEITWRFK